MVFAVFELAGLLALQERYRRLENFRLASRTDPQLLIAAAVAVEDAALAHIPLPLLWDSGGITAL